MSTPKVLLVEDKRPKQMLAPFLEKNRFSVISTGLSGLALGNLVTENKAEIVVFNIESPVRGILDEICAVNRQFAIPVIIFATDNNTETINQVVKRLRGRWP